MIPRIAWIHWAQDGPPMSWLREAGVASFKKQNPDWTCNVVDTLPEIKHRGLKWWQEADWTWWTLLARHGGFLVASDVIHVRPMPEAWLDADLCAQSKGQHVHQFASLGAVPGNPLMVHASEACKAHSSPIQDQAMGVHLLHALVGEGDVRTKYGKFVNMPQDAFCSYNWAEDVVALWNGVPAGFALPDSAIGIHWYGGHWATRQHERTSSPTGPSLIEHIASEALR